MEIKLCLVLLKIWSLTLNSESILTLRKLLEREVTSYENSLSLNDIGIPIESSSLACWYKGTLLAEMEDCLPVPNIKAFTAEQLRPFLLYIIKIKDGQWKSLIDDCDDEDIVYLVLTTTTDACYASYCRYSDDEEPGLIYFEADSLANLFAKVIIGLYLAGYLNFKKNNNEQ